MTDITILRLRGRDIEVDGAMRAAILDEMPEIGWISSEGLRRQVLDAWAAAVASAGLERIGAMKPSGNYDSMPLRTGTQADHIRSVTRIALKMAEEMDALFPDFLYDREERCVALPNDLVALQDYIRSQRQDPPQRQKGAA